MILLRITKDGNPAQRSTLDILNRKNVTKLIVAKTEAD